MAVSGSGPDGAGACPIRPTEIKGTRARQPTYWASLRRLATNLFFTFLAPSRLKRYCGIILLQNEQAVAELPVPRLRVHNYLSTRTELFTGLNPSLKHAHPNSSGGATGVRSNPAGATRASGRPGRAGTASPRCLCTAAP